MKSLFKLTQKLLKTVVFIFLALLILFAAFVFRIFTAPMVPRNYTKTVKTGAGIEAAYLKNGSYQVSYTEAEAPGDWKKYEIYYPSILLQSKTAFPVVVLVNGTGVFGSKYKALFRHLASWGFIVLGNEDPSTCTGDSADAVLAYLLEENERADSIFYQKVDRNKIGISGHSQGGAGVFNAVTANAHSGLYQTAVALSPTNEETANELQMAYDIKKLAIPTLMLAGTKGDFETKLVIPLEQMKKMFEKLDVPKVMARKTGCEHGQMLYAADGYVTAWLMWQLKGDKRAAQAFLGEDAEILTNPLYQDQKILL